MTERTREKRAMSGAAAFGDGLRRDDAGLHGQPDDYSDIIHLPHHVSMRHPHMSRTERAGQFGAFEPIKDYKDAISEKSRLTEARPELSEEDERRLNDAVRRLLDILSGKMAEAGAGEEEKENGRDTGISVGGKNGGSSGAAENPETLQDHRVGHHPQAVITRFVPDERKEGGRIEDVTGYVRSVNMELRYLVLEDGSRIPFRDMLGIRIVLPGETDSGPR